MGKPERKVRSKKLAPANDFGCWLAERKLTYDYAAKELDVTRSYIGMLAGGRATPALKLAGRIADWTDGKVAVDSWFRT